LILNLIIKVWFALEAGRPLAEDRKQGALEMLLSTPLTVKDILRGQLLALLRQFQGPVAVVLLVFLLFMILGASDTISLQEAADRSLWVLVWAAALVMLLADLAALHWLGMWQGLTAKNATRAAAANLGCILLLPWAVVTLGMLAAALVWPNADDRQVMSFFLASWFVLSLGADLGFGVWARHRLLTGFRIAATQRYESRPGFWKQLLGGGEQGRRASPPGEMLHG
jgi:ABC-type Na+ efflux pump permease subunit